MSDPFHNQSRGVTAPALGAFAVTPSDSADLARPIRQITLAVAGTLAFVTSEGESCTTGLLPAGSYPVFARRILATGTTASGLTGWV